jgi:PAS domain S-box-containing protein
MTDEEAFLKVADLLPEPMLLVAADGTILTVNRACGERLRGLPQPLPGHRLQDLASDPPAEVAAYLRDCSRSRQLVLGSLRFPGSSTSAVWRCEGEVYQSRREEEPAVLLLRLQPRESVVQRFLLLNQRVDELHREIVRRREVEAALRDQREWLRVTLASIGDAVIATDTVGRVTFLNPTARELTGWPEAEVTSRPLEEIFHILNEETREPAQSPVAKVLREGVIAGLANHTVLIARDGREIPIDDSAAPIRGDDGKFLGVVMVFHDISERRALERELQRRAERLTEADRRKDEFLAMLAHELRNPLVPIRNGLYIMTLPGASPEAVSRVREMMQRQILHMVRLVDDLLDVSRITRGKIELRKEVVEITGLIRRTVEVVEPQARANGLALDLSLPMAPVAVEADPTRLDQVMINLLNNALKFTPAGGRVEVDARLAGDDLRIAVRDTGVGIEPELLSEVFEPFLQGSHSMDRSQGGLGIGLTLVRTLVEMHGGTVTAHSAGRGQGSELVVLLPVAQGADPDQKISSSTAGRQSG